MDILQKDLRRLFSIKYYLEKRPLLLYGFLLLFGIWAACHIVIPWYCLTRSPENTYMGFRLMALDNYIQQILSGGLPQVVSLADHNPSLYLYASYLGVLTGKTEAWQVFLFLQIGAAAFVLLLYPTLIYKLTHAILPACVSPFLLEIFLGKILIEIKTDTYWSLAWVAAAGLPLIAIYYKEQKGISKWAAFAGICLCMGFGNIPRLHGSLGIFLLLFLIVIKDVYVLLKAEHKRNIAFMAGLLIVALFSYTLFTDTVPRLYVAVTGQEGQIEDFGPWHAIFAGLGWEENKYGFQFNDGYVASEVVQKIDSSATYLSPEYMDILKTEWFRLWRDDFGYMLGTYFRKFKACVDLDWQFCTKFNSSNFNGKHWLTGLLLTTSILWRYTYRHRRIWFSWGLLLFASLFCGLVTLIFPMITIPGGGYIFGSFAACGMLFFFWALAVLQGVLRAAEDFSQKAPAKL